MPRLRLLSILVVFLCLAGPARAGTGFWTPLGPDGAQVTALAVSPIQPDELFVASQQGGIYKSSDGGATWGLLGRGTGTETIVDLAVDPHHYGTAYAAGESGAVFKTIDGGGNWFRVWAGASLPSGGRATVFALVTDARRADTLFAATRAGVYRSTDGGVTWAARGTLPSTARALAYDAAGGWLYTGVDGQGVFRSFNQGRSWERAGTGLPPNPFVVFLAVDPDRPRTLLAATTQGLYRSLDRGGRWQKVGGVPEVSARNIAFQGRGRVYATFSAGIFASADSGATWRRSAVLPGRSGGDFQALAVGPERVHVGLFGDPDGPGLYRSLDFGATFAPAVAGLPGLAVGPVAVDPTNPQTIYAGVGPSTVYKSTDGGATWQRWNLGLAGGFYPVADLLIDPERPATLWVVGAANPRVLRSDDAGQTWQQLGGIGEALLDIAVDPRAPEALWGAGWRGVFHSADGGATWELVDLGVPGFFNLEKILVDSRDPNVVHAAGASIAGVRPPIFQAAVLRSTDGGVTWERRDTGLVGGSVLDFAQDAANPDTLYAANGRLFRSTDGGATWTAAPGLAGFSYVIVETAPASSGTAPGTPAAVYTGRQFPAGMVLRSTDQGLTWTPLRRGLAPGLPHELTVDPTDPAHLLLGTQNRSLLSYTVR